MPSAALRTMRPHQWVKNLFVLAPLVFARELFDLEVALRALIAFASFCAASSTVYVVNDLIDVEADRAHPLKQHRPIASGALLPGTARALAAVLVLAAIGTGWTLGLDFVALLGGYLALNLAYSLRLKRVAYLDVLSIGAGFELRVLGGATAAQVPASAYLLLVTLVLALFLGFGKRLHELHQGQDAHEQRAVLRFYDEKKVTILLWLSAIATIAIYAVYTIDSETRSHFGTDYLIATTPFTVYGVLRFLQLVRGTPHAESPTEEMLRDKPFLTNLILWIVSVLVILYLT